MINLFLKSVLCDFENLMWKWLINGEGKLARKRSEEVLILRGFEKNTN